MDNTYYGGHYDDETQQNIPSYPLAFDIQEQDHASASVLCPSSTSPLGGSISISPTDRFSNTGAYGDYDSRGIASLMPESSYYAPTEPVSAYNNASLSMSSGPHSFPNGQIHDELDGGVMNQGPPPPTGWGPQFQSFTPFAEDPRVAMGVGERSSGVPYQYPPSTSKCHKSHAANPPFQGLTIDTMTMNPHGDRRPHKSAVAAAKRSKGKKPSAPTTSLSSPTSQSTISSGSAAPNSLPEEDCDSEQEQAGSTGRQGHHNARTRHNMVEQKYRHRLNTHFDKLLEVLPSGVGVGGMMMGDGYQNTYQTTYLGGDGGAPSLERERKVSKAEVLDRARLYIQRLESEHVRLQREREELRGLWEGYYERAAGVGKGLDGGV
ncbi:hypothetical protein QC761_607160 [Podospora bellae-mahoneyi]|uniref:BHLH domain-containing protein n=1 Tax=Podospora bellae-mahoneyi TaxID=2093777 RepID=A0ABR0FA33_9PEZI|nr:hypothetical protein QC761_607160 [Podospora bellae-mahoneyi]